MIRDDAVQQVPVPGSAQDQPVEPPTRGATAATRRGARLPALTRRDAGPAALVIAFGVLTFLVVRTALVDDAYITMSYARNVGLHGTWGLLSDVPSNAATSPAWVLLLSATTAVVRNTIVALGLLHVLMLLTAFLALRATARRTGLPSWVAPVGVVLVAVNPLVMSTVGLETELLVTLVTCLLAAGTAGRPVVFGLVAGLVFLTRMDTAFAVALFPLFFPAVLRRLHVVVGVALAVVVPWSWWSWLHLGSVLPDTLLIKSGQHSWGGYDVGNGWGWWLQFDSRLVVLAAWGPMAAGAVAAVGLVYVAARGAGLRLRPWIALAVAGAAHWETLSLINVPPYHWYFGLAISAGTLTVVAFTGALTAGATGSQGVAPRVVGSRVVAARGVAAAVCAVLLATFCYVDAAQPAKGSLAPSDRAALPWRVAPIQSNWMTSAAYDAMGRDLRRLLTAPDGTVQRVSAFGEIGHLAYVCDCLVDGFADPALLEPAVAELRERSSPLRRSLLDLDHRYRDTGQRPVPLAGHLVYMPSPQVPPPGAPSWPVDLNPGGGSIVLLRG